MCMSACKNWTNYFVGTPICMEGVQKLNKLLIQFVFNVLVIMFDPVRRISNLYGGVQKLDKLLIQFIFTY
jgi:hypothetical protein